MKISVIVTNWNGLDLLKKNLEQVIKTSPEAQEIIVADDASSDKSVQYIKELQKKYPKLKLIANKNNLGFGKNSNNAVAKSKGELVVMLNSDIFPHKDYIKNSLKHFSDPNLLGVGFSEFKHENWSRVFWKNGYLQHERGGIGDTKVHITSWLSGGDSIIRKSIFQKLGGFDEIYSPFYCEDLDLGLRAWKSGYTLLWDPDCVVEHKHESTISKFSKNFLNYVKERNRLLSTWRNITDPQLIFTNKLAQIGRVLSGPNYIKIIRAANKQIKKSKPPIVFPKLSDKEIFEKFK